MKWWSYSLSRKLFKVKKKYNADFSKNYGDGYGIGDTDGSAYWFHSAGHGSVTESSKVFQHEMEKN